MIPINKKKIYLFSEFFPYGNGETFLEHELPVWLKSNKRVTIFPIKPVGNKRKCGVHKIADTVNLDIVEGYNLKKLPLKLIVCCLLFFATELSQNRKNNKLRLSLLFREAFLGVKLLNKYPEIAKGVCYSYWCNHWMLRLSLLRKAGLIKHLVCRVHGFDLYSERHLRGFIPYQKSMLQSADKVFAISEHGCNYLKLKFNLNNMYVSRLGVSDNGINPFGNNIDVIQIVSCSALIEVKQVHKLIKALHKVNRKVNWVHFGDGVLADDLKRLAHKLPQHIKVNWAGNKPNKEILQFYKENEVHLFVNVSKSEGIPVSIMEAMSFGIPVAAPNVGGIPEIVNQENGFLINNKNICNSLAEVLNGNKFLQSEKRENARRMFLEKYSLNNYTSFINKI